MMPRVSVLMTIYNPGPYLEPAIDSLLAQTFRDFELVAVENGSRDGAKEIIRRYAAADSRVRVIELPENIGRVPALNRALKEARGEYAAVLDADDVAHVERLAREVAVLDARPEVVLVGSHARYIDGKGKVVSIHAPPIDPAFLREALAYINPFPHSSVMFRCAAASAVGGYCPRYPFANDFALWLALTQHGEPAMIDEPLADIRYHSSNTSLAPAHYFSRFHESLELFRVALARPGLSSAVRRRGRTNMANLHCVLAWELVKAKRPLPALWHLARGFFIAPVFCVREARIRLPRLRAMKDSKAGALPLRRP